MPTKLRITKMLVVTAAAALVLHTSAAWGNKPKASGRARVTIAATPVPIPPDAADARSTLEAAADALGMLRNAGLGGGRNPRLDVINTMEFWASGTPFTDYHVLMAYNPPGMRIELTNPKGNPQHAIEVVTGKYAWNESEVGGGLIPGKGMATPDMAVANVRLLRLWTLPYGVIKAGLAARDKAKVSNENGVTVVTFPLTGQLTGVTVKATLDQKNFVTKVETQGPANLTTETEYSDYADRGDIPTDVQFPGHIVRKKDGKTIVDLTVKKADGNNPYVVIPVPDNVLSASAK
jgi:hypothetical protein